MISKTSVLANIKKLNSLFNKANNAKEGLFFSKLAILELCGWIEESMDDIVRMVTHRKCRDRARWKTIESLIKKNSGFDYESNFKKLLIYVVGEIGIEKVERRINQNTLTTLIATLGNLKTYRNIEAHTHIKGVTKQIDAPSVTMSNFHKVYDGLKEYEKTLRLTGY